MAKKRKTQKIISEKVEYEVSSGNVFRDFGCPNPEKAEAKLDLALIITSIIRQRKLSQQKAAKLMGIDQPKVSKLTRGLLSEFTIERLIKYLLALGFDIEIKPTIGKTLSPSIHVSSHNLNRLRAS